ncbi:Tetracycline efflux protein TetA [Candidatus Phaeomarinobacter ectocarpi]|uniref:Tetracycline efflux protein TetA n=1 Tax=Candidatus Phaeomarinibacter ectocarpi TaxID=1458461 RepID=X5MDN5_9HYPH|nr:tetracycline resistance MFS efflux pump [Candidatus Phaeomarinobacter ectocarpi]CDO58634.1 Tetracycline efflux protein TetA [Candidatus Phaeomarinobacter ectocarpi]
MSSEAEATKNPVAKRALPFLLITILIDAIGVGIIVPVLPSLITEVTELDLSDAALWGGALIFIYALMSFLFAPVLGNLSDRFGRRPVLIIGLTVLGIDYVVMALAPTIWWLLVGRTMSGIAAATFTTANAYIADVTTPNDRAKSYGLLGAAWGTGFMMGPVLGGLVADFADSARAPFYLAAVLAFANAAYGFLLLPESLPPEKRRAFDIKRANTIGAIRMVAKHPGLLGLLIAMVFYQIGHDANPAIWSFYTMYKFGWDAGDVGWSLGFVGVCLIFSMGWLTGYAVPRLGEKRAILIGFTSAGIGFLGYALATQSWMMYVATIFFAMVGIGSSALRSVLSKQVSETEQGELQGAITSVMGLTAIFTPLVMTGLFSAFTGDDAPIHLPGAPYLLATVAMVASICMVLIFIGRVAVKPQPARGDAD